MSQRVGALGQRAGTKISKRRRSWDCIVANRLSTTAERNKRGRAPAAGGLVAVAGRGAAGQGSSSPFETVAASTPISLATFRRSGALAAGDAVARGRP
jgi:hypothetical protein